MSEKKINKSWFLLAMDTALSVLSSLLAILLVRWLSHPVFGFSHYVLIWLLMSLAFSLVGFLTQRSYRIALEYATLRSIGKISASILIKELLMLVFILVNIFGIRNLDDIFLVLVMDALLTYAILILMHLFITIILQERHQSIEFDVNRMSILIYGISNKSAALVRRLSTSSHYNPVGFVTTDPAYTGMIIQDCKTYCCTDKESLEALCIGLGGIDGIIFARQSDADAEKDGIIKWSQETGVNILMSPNIELVGDNADEGVPAAAEAFRELASDPDRIKNDEKRGEDFIPDGMSGFERNIKRIVDCVAAAILLIVFSPVFLICYIAIKREDHGPALFRQERIGRFGRPFNILKFRTMRTDAEASGPALYGGDDDPRLTKVGKFLREHHLDELPQLWNVFVGDMAFVGYRPERQFYIDQITKKDPRYVCLYQIRPGVTSYATLRNGYTDTIEKMIKRLQFDLYYLKNRSWWFDIKVLWLTFTNIVFGKKF